MNSHCIRHKNGNTSKKGLTEEARSACQGVIFLGTTRITPCPTPVGACDPLVGNRNVVARRTECLCSLLAEKCQFTSVVFFVDIHTELLRVSTSLCDFHSVGLVSNKDTDVRKSLVVTSNSRRFLAGGCRSFLPLEVR